MNPLDIERTAIRLIQKYGKKALPKAVEVTKYYLNSDDEEAAKRWVKIGYEIKKLQQIESISEVITESETPEMIS